MLFTSPVLSGPAHIIRHYKRGRRKQILSRFDLPPKLSDPSARSVLLVLLRYTRLYLLYLYSSRRALPLLAYNKLLSLPT